MPIFDTQNLLRELPFDVSTEELDAFEAKGTTQFAGAGCGNIVCREPS